MLGDLLQVKKHRSYVKMHDDKVNDYCQFFCIFHVLNAVHIL